MPLSAPWPPPEPPSLVAGSPVRSELPGHGEVVATDAAAAAAHGFAVAAVLFDLDDTLLDADAAWRTGVRRLTADRVPDLIDQELAVDAWAEVFPDWFDRYLLGELTLEESRAGRVRDWARLIDAPLPAGDELAWFDSYLVGYRAGWRLFADVPDVLADLCGLPIGIVTNGDSEQQREKVVGLGLDLLVDVVVVSSEVGAAKPDPRMLLVAAERMGVDPAQCLMVGDRLDRDVAAALAAGMGAVWLRRPDGPEADTVPPTALGGRFAEIASLDELPALALGWPCGLERRGADAAADSLGGAAEAG